MHHYMLPVLCWTTVRGQQDIRFDAFKKRIQIKASLNLRLRYGLCQSVAGRERLVLFHVVHDSSKRASCGHNGNNEADAAQYLQAKPVGAPLRDLRNGHFYGEVHSQQPKP